MRKKHTKPAGDARAVDEVFKAGKEAKSKKEVAACGCCVKDLVGTIPTVLPVERWCHGGKLRYGSIVKFLRNMFAKTSAQFGPAFSE